MGWQTLYEPVSSQNKVVIYTILVDGENYSGIIRHLG